MFCESRAQRSAISVGEMLWVGRCCGRRCGSSLFLGLWAGGQRAKLSNLGKLAAREKVGKQVVCGGYPMCRRDYMRPWYTAELSVCMAICLLENSGSQSRNAVRIASLISL
jgi:hypothetical protein